MLKYIMCKDGPVIFPMSMRHDTFKALHPTSAGMFMLHDKAVDVYGESTSLGLTPAPGDAAAIAAMLRL